jgi:hypothetical protein
MLAEADKYATADKKKRQNIDLKIRLKHYALKLKRTWSFQR